MRRALRQRVSAITVTAALALSMAAAYAVMDDPFAQGTAYGLKLRLEAMGVLTVADEVYAPDTTDFSVIGAKIADTNADILVGGTQYPDAVNLILVLQQLNYQPRMAAFSTAPTNAEFPAATSPAPRPSRCSPPGCPTCCRGTACSGR